MANFISELRKYNITSSYIEEELIVLPCAHELNYKEDGKCDGRQFLSANENIMNCDSSRPECQTEGGHNVNWDIYTRFYNGTRTKSNSGKQKCRDTDMIKEAIEYIGKFPKIEAVLFGASSKGHIQENIKLIEANL